ncbi:Glu-tRNA(Gln) amidotransferase subunit GatE [Methanogenium sp. MK-MG]|uniref:Glu-tRNA(Gln) amidotransferase subunit GatE n=1 Tax=Methanogenium sp. MK-MG TaxID=2599926 RepID=UPI0013EA2B19|nr:Glu-tRNA(Gln) amidotransferase subunit GatE [Methanogenium sp. MK-MG]KAF1078062.1 Glutamyl-tRNA(Gln) amidotransferase subunit E [Methanogenium sp. MK-MG]
MADYDYAKLGLKAGIEIHQQLDTREKLFCHCPTVLRDAEEHNAEFFRYLRATVSEMGEIDRAAREEMMVMRPFTYYAYDTTCLVENDEEPPAPLNPEALALSLTIARMMGMTPVEQVHVMRKLVIDGSNTSGFQRTGMVALNGSLPTGERIESICLEEEAAQRIEDQLFSLDRLGIPLAEITTAPDMHTPEAVKAVAAYIGMLLRSTMQVKRGIGTIRQDVNVSIREGARVEIKGVQELRLIDEVVRREVQRQVNLLAIRDELLARHASVDEETHDVTALFTETGSAILKRAKTIHAVCLRGYAGLVGREIQPGRRLGSEMSDYAKKCGVGGLFHTDELPAYGVTEAEAASLKKAVGAGPNDCVVLVADARKKVVCAIAQVRRRADMARDGVPEETRKMLEEGSSAYMRPLPGAARMYPETDVLPVTVTDAYYDALVLPELLSDKADRYVRDMGLDASIARQMVYSRQCQLFDEAVSRGVKSTLAAHTLLGTLKELSRDSADVAAVPGEALVDLLLRVEAGTVAKEAIPPVIRALSEGQDIDTAINAVAPSVSREEVRAIICKTIAEREAFVREQGMRAVGPLMGVVMKELRGRADGKVISELLKEEVGRIA